MVPRAYRWVAINSGQRGAQRYQDLTDERFGRLLVIGKHGKKRYGGRNSVILWQCRCDCGNTSVVPGVALKSGATQSCGCYDRETKSERAKKRRTHGETRDGASIEYVTRQHIIARCENPTHKDYKNYGGRGIAVCERWKASVENFIADMGRRPEGHSLDRIDVDGPYSPENCRWATAKTQNRNKRSRRTFEYEGKTLSISEIAELNGLTFHELYQRVVGFKWPLEKAIAKAKMLRSIGH